uniref:hypothetical protein n=1 Tax=Pectobacterium versatile TaxID=2488639 RepID=UPI001A9D12A1
LEEARQYWHNQAYAYSIQGDGAEDDDERIVRFHSRRILISTIWSIKENPIIRELTHILIII